LVSGDTVDLPERPVPSMSADLSQGDDRVRDVIDALTSSVDTLAAMVRETTGSLAANRGEVASLDRRVQEPIGEGSQRAAAEALGHNPGCGLRSSSRDDCSAHLAH